MCNSHVIKKPLVQGNFYLTIVFIAIVAAPIFRLAMGFLLRLFFPAQLPGQQNGAGDVK